jgi:hypothetical protein
VGRLAKREREPLAWPKMYGVPRQPLKLPKWQLLEFQAPVAQPVQVPREAAIEEAILREGQSPEKMSVQWPVRA